MARGSASLFDQIQAQGRKVIAAIEAEIADRQSQLDDLREQAGLWLAAMGGGVTPKRRGRPAAKAPAVAKQAAGPRAGRPKAARPKRKSPPVDWEKVLARLPKSFGMQDVAKATPALKDHAQARVIAVARWSRSGLIAKVGEGKYRKSGKKAA